MSMDLWFAQQAMAGNLYRGGNIGSTIRTGLNVTHTGLVLANPVASTVNLIVRSYTVAQDIIGTALQYQGLCTGPNVDADDVAHTTPCVVHNGLERGSNVNNGVGTLDESATLPNTPVALDAVRGTLTQVGDQPRVEINFMGSLILPPGTYVADYFLQNAPTGLGYFSWVEQATSNLTINP